MNDPERVARAIVRCARRPPRELLVGRGARAMVAMQALGGPLFERVFAKQVERNHFLDEPAGPSPGNLFEPLPKRRRDDRWLARAPAPAPIPGPGEQTTSRASPEDSGTGTAAEAAANVAPHSLRIIGLAGPACELAEQRREALALESAVDPGDLPAECSRALGQRPVGLVKRPVWPKRSAARNPGRGLALLCGLGPDADT